MHKTNIKRVFDSNNQRHKANRIAQIAYLVVAAQMEKQFEEVDF